MCRLGQRAMSRRCHFLSVATSVNVPQQVNRTAAATAVYVQSTYHARRGASHCSTTHRYLRVVAGLTTATVKHDSCRLSDRERCAVMQLTALHAANWRSLPGRWYLPVPRRKLPPRSMASTLSIGHDFQLYTRRLHSLNLPRHTSSARAEIE